MARDNYRKPFEPMPLGESLKGVKELLAQTGSSDYRRHATEGALRSAINRLGYRPTETKESPATLEQLVGQLELCLKESPPEETVAFEVRMHLHSAHSNLKADAGQGVMPALKEVPKAVALLLMLFTLLFAPTRAKALDSFNVTNVLSGGSNFLFQQWPTNALSTNLTIVSYTTNGAQITTNGYYLGEATGLPLDVRNYSEDGLAFVASWYGVTNAATTWYVKLVRAWSDNTPRVIWNTNTGVIQTNDWESLPGITLSWIQTNSGPGLWATNLDQYALASCTYVGVYYWSNQAFGLSETNLWDTNIVMGLQRVHKVRGLTSGNF